MADDDLLSRISALVEEEHRLRQDHAGAGSDSARLADLEVALDQCWDLLRQRRARRETGEDPGQAHVRPADVVDHYEQ